MLLDLHVHSRFTPGCPLEPAEAVRRAEELGLDGICFTDRDTFGVAKELASLRANTKLTVLVGTELVTDHGHYLAFFPQPAELEEPAKLFGKAGGGLPSAREVVEKVRSLGGIAVAAHPYDRDVERPAGDFIFTLRGLSAVEGFCGTRRNNVNELAIEAADHLSLPCVGGSGAMNAEGLGTAATLLRDPVRTEAELIDAIKGGAVWAVAIGSPPKFLGDEMAARERTRERSGERHDRREGRGERREERRDDRRGGGHRRRGGRGRGGGGGRR